MKFVKKYCEDLGFTDVETNLMLEKLGLIESKTSASKVNQDTTPNKPWYEQWWDGVKDVAGNAWDATTDFFGGIWNWVVENKDWIITGLALLATIAATCFTAGALIPFIGALVGPGTAAAMATAAPVIYGYVSAAITMATVSSQLLELKSSIGAEYNIMDSILSLTNGAIMIVNALVGAITIVMDAYNSYQNIKGSGNQQISNTKFDHINNNHNYNKLEEQINARLSNGQTMEQIYNDLKYDTSVFSPALSENQIRNIVNQAYNKALESQILNGSFTTIINGETVTVVLENGNIKTSWGAFNFWDIFKGGE